MKRTITAITLIAAALGATVASAGDKSTGTRGGGSFSITADGQVLWVDHPEVRGASFGDSDPLTMLGEKIARDLKRAEHLLEPYGLKHEFFQKYIYNPNIGYYFATTADFQKESVRDCPNEYSASTPQDGSTVVPGGCTKGNTTTFDWNYFLPMIEKDVPPARNYGAVRALLHEALHRVPGEHSAILWNIVSDGLAELLALQDEQDAGSRRTITESEASVLAGLLHALRQFEIGGLDDSYLVASGGGIVSVNDTIGPSAFVGVGSKIDAGVQVDNDSEIIDSRIASYGLRIQNGTRVTGSSLICSAIDACRGGGSISASTIDHSVLTFISVDIQGVEIRESRLSILTGSIQGRPDSGRTRGAVAPEEPRENDKGTAIVRSVIEAGSLKVASADIRDSQILSNWSGQGATLAEIAEGVNVRFSQLKGERIRLGNGAQLLGNQRPGGDDSYPGAHFSVGLSAYGPIDIGNGSQLKGDVTVTAFREISLGNQVTLSLADLKHLHSFRLADESTLEDVAFNAKPASWTMSSTEDSLLLERGARLSHIADTRLSGKGSKSPTLIVPANVAVDNGSRPICAEENTGMVLRGKEVFRNATDMAKTCKADPKKD